MHKGKRSLVSSNYGCSLANLTDKNAGKKSGASVARCLWKVVDDALAALVNNYYNNITSVDCVHQSPKCVRV